MAFKIFATSVLANELNVFSYLVKHNLFGIYKRKSNGKLGKAPFWSGVPYRSRNAFFRNLLSSHLRIIMSVLISSKAMRDEKYGEKGLLLIS